MTENKNCENCEYAVLIDSDLYACHLNPPVVTGNHVSCDNTGFPMVKSCCFCSGFKNKGN